MCTLDSHYPHLCQHHVVLECGSSISYDVVLLFKYGPIVEQQRNIILYRRATCGHESVVVGGYHHLSLKKFSKGDCLDMAIFVRSLCASITCRCFFFVWANVLATEGIP